MDKKKCDRCGRELSSGDAGFCPDCKENGGANKKSRRLFAVAVVALLIFSGAAMLYAAKSDWEFSWDAVLGRPAAVVNGERLDRSEARTRITISRLMLEKEYGKGLFSGEQGSALLSRLEREILEKMVIEHLIAREAARMKIHLDDERVRQEMQKIGREIYGSWENFQASMSGDGIPQEYLMSHFRNMLLREEVRKAKSPPGADSDTNFVAWLEQERRSTKVIVKQATVSLPESAVGAGGCCGSGSGGGCGTKPKSGALNPELEREAGAAALAKYQKKNPADKELQARVTDLGCHIQVDIEKGGKTVGSYSYQDGKVTDN